VARKYEFHTEDDKVPLYSTMAATFPTVLALFKALLELASADVAIAEMLKLICKIFWSASFLELPPMFRDPRSPETVVWLQCFLLAVSKPVPDGGAPQSRDIDARNSWPWWKTKKWALHVAGRLFSRYGDPKTSPLSRKEFAQSFMTEWSPRFLEAHMSLLAPLRRPIGSVARVDPAAWLPPRCMNLCMQFLQRCLHKKVTYAIMRPHMQSLLLELAFPELCFDAHDANLWAEDPLEYVRKGYDIIEDLYSPRVAAIGFIVEACSVRKKDSVNTVLQFMASALQGCAEAMVGADQVARDAAYCVKDGAMLLVGALSDLLRSKQHRHHLQPLLQRFVLPEFESPQGHLRAKATYVAGKFAEPKLLGDELFNGLLERIVGLLGDAELPVRVDAVVALRPFVEEAQLDALRPILPQLLNNFFKLIHEVENEDLVFTLETLVEQFGKEIAPFAFGLTNNLCQALWRYMGQEGSEEEGADLDDSGSLAAVACLRAIATILESLSSLPHLYPQLEPVLVPLLRKLLTAEGQDVFEEALEITSYLTYFAPTLSPALWSLWSPIAKSLTEWAIDYMDNALVPMDNFISRGTDFFLAPGSPYIAQTFAIAKHVLVDVKMPDEDATAAAKLLECVLLNCSGRVDDWVAHFVGLVLVRLEEARSWLFQDHLVCVVAAALYYNPVLALGVLQHHDGGMGHVSLLARLLTMIFECDDKMRPRHFKTEFKKKLIVVALSQMVALPVRVLSAELVAAEAKLLQGIVKLLQDLRKQIAERESHEERDEVDRRDEESEIDEDLDGEEGDDDDKDSYLENLSSAARSYQWEVPRITDGVDADSDDGAWLGSGDDDFQTPLDAVDAFAAFKNALVALEHAEGARFATLASSLPAEIRASLNELMQYAETREVPWDGECRL